MIDCLGVPKSERSHSKSGTMNGNKLDFSADSRQPKKEHYAQFRDEEGENR